MFTQTSIHAEQLRKIMRELYQEYRAAREKLEENLAQAS
jgi:hypothetical protein